MDVVNCVIHIVHVVRSVAVMVMVQWFMNENYKIYYLLFIDSWLIAFQGSPTYSFTRLIHNQCSTLSVRQCSLDFHFDHKMFCFQRVSTALHSVHEIYIRRNSTGEQVNYKHCIVYSNDQHFFSFLRLCTAIYVHNGEDLKIGNLGTVHQEF